MFNHCFIGTSFHLNLDHFVNKGHTRLSLLAGDLTAKTVVLYMHLPPLPITIHKILVPDNFLEFDITTKKYIILEG